MNPPNFSVVPKIASVAGGIALATGIPNVGFALLTGSAVLNLLVAIGQRQPGDVGFFGAWATLNAWFATHIGTQ
jgi:hypothetical protein